MSSQCGKGIWTKTKDWKITVEVLIWVLKISFVFAVGSSLLWLFLQGTVFSLWADCVHMHRPMYCWFTWLLFFWKWSMFFYGFLRINTMKIQKMLSHTWIQENQICFCTVEQECWPLFPNPLKWSASCSFWKYQYSKMALKTKASHQIRIASFCIVREDEICSIWNVEAESQNMVQ